MPFYLVAVMIVACCALCVTHIIWCFRFEVWKRETRNYLEDSRLCNAEFAEAIALLKYGAVDEAIELTKRWEERAKANH